MVTSAVEGGRGQAAIDGMWSLLMRDDEKDDEMMMMTTRRGKGGVERGLEEDV